MSWLESFLQWSAEIDLNFWFLLVSVWFLILCNYFMNGRVDRLEDYVNSLLFRFFELEESIRQCSASSCNKTEHESKKKRGLE